MGLDPQPVTSGLLVLVFSECTGSAQPGGPLGLPVAVPRYADDAVLDQIGQEEFYKL